MQKRTWKRIVITAASVLALSIVVLAVHIWWVMRPHIDGSTRIMARIDIRQPVGVNDASRITAWLYRQKGVDHVLVNPSSAIAIFTYAPLQGNANVIAKAFGRELSYPHATRYLPAESEMQGGCPVATTSFAYKAYVFMKRIF